MGQKRFTIAAQLSSVHSPEEQLEPGAVRARLEAAAQAVHLDILAVGWLERPPLFRLLTGRDTRQADQVFLWYPLLSDYPGFRSGHLVVGSDASRSRGWGGYQGTGIAESFKQACPNNPRAVATSLRHLEALLAAYDFDGVFVDKIRFPSMANGLREVFSCFCPHCRRQAARAGLDLEEVKAALMGRGGESGSAGREAAALPPGAEWLEELLAERPLLRRFVRFRADAISAVVARVAELLRRRAKKLALDVFSPSLGALVGQDFPALARHADWMKPMIYRFGNGPSSLRTELPAMIRGLGSYLGCGQEEAWSWAAARLPGLQGSSLEQLAAAAPLGLVRAETRKALGLLAGTPLYLGLESVSIPGLMPIGPRQVREILELGSEEGVQGFVLSWDLLHTPLENVAALKSLPAG